MDVSNRRGLGTWLALAFSLLAVFVAAVLIAVSEQTASSQVRTTIGQNLAELAHQTTSRLDRSMFERYREVRLMADRVTGQQDLGQVRRELDGLQRTYPYYAWMGLTDPAGKVLTATGGVLTGADVSARPWFREARQGRTLGDVHEAVLLAKLLANPTGEPMRFVDIAFPIPAAGGSPGGVLGVHLSWRWAADVRDAIFVPVGRSSLQVEPLIVSRTGVVLLGPPGLQGQELDLASLQAADRGSGYLTERWPDGKEYLVGYSRDQGHREYPGLGWRVLVRQELREAYAPVAQLQQRLLTWGLAAALLISVLGWFVARLITRPVLDLANAARGIEEGRLSQVPEGGASYREVAQLGTAFNSLVANLQQKEADLRELNVSLEQRVQERTAQLQAAFEQLRENQERIQTIIESAPDPFVGMDFRGRITDWNPRAEALFGWKRAEVMGRDFEEVLVPPRFRGTVGAALAGYKASGQADFAGQVLERVVVDRSGREIPVEVRIGLIDTGKLQLFSAFVHDITGRKEVERLKGEFISTVSHELRTPLTAIYGSLSLLQSGMAGELPPSARELVEMSNQSCERLVRLINDVLDLEKMDTGSLRYELTPQPLRPLVERSVADTQPYADGWGVRLELEPPVDAQVKADADRILQVMVNLLSNAAKFSPRGGVVKVGMALRGGAVRVSVTDQGPGIPEEFRPRVFERFAQADGSDRRQKGGTGLGLNICRRIVEAHQGRIGFNSDPGVRTEFWFELPLA